MTKTQPWERFATPRNAVVANVALWGLIASGVLLAFGDCEVKPVRECAHVPTRSAPHVACHMVRP